MVILAFGLVYLFWGSTYLAIDVAVQTIPPALMCGIRFSIAGVIMLAVCAAIGRKIFYSPRQIALASIVGLLLLMGGNLTLSYAELAVSSGLAALIIAVTPLWFLVLDQLLWAITISRVGAKQACCWASWDCSFSVWPELRAGSLGPPRTDRLHQPDRRIVQLGARFRSFEALESGMDVFSSTGWQIVAAGVRQLHLRHLLRRPEHATWSHRSLAAVGYLIVCGSWIGYTAYISCWSTSQRRRSQPTHTSIR